MTLSRLTTAAVFGIAPSIASASGPGQAESLLLFLIGSFAFSFCVHLLALGLFLPLLRSGRLKSTTPAYLVPILGMIGLYVVFMLSAGAKDAWLAHGFALTGLLTPIVIYAPLIALLGKQRST